MLIEVGKILDICTDIIHMERSRLESNDACSIQMNFVRIFQNFHDSDSLKITLIGLRTKR